MDKTLLGVLAGSYAENAYYEQADKIVKLLLTIATSLGTVMLPRISYAYAHGLKEDVERYMMRSYRFTWFLTIPMCLGLMAVAPSFVPWFFGPGYEPVTTVLQVISGIIIAIGLSNVTGIQYLIPTNRQNELTLSVTMGAIFNLCMNLYMIPRYQAVGVALATLLTEWLVTIVQFYMVRHDLHLKRILSISRMYWLVGIIMFIMVYAIGQYARPTFFYTIIISSVGGIVYFIGLLALKDNLIYAVLNKARSKLHI